MYVVFCVEQVTERNCKCIIFMQLIGAALANPTCSCTSIDACTVFILIEVIISRDRHVIGTHA